MKEKEIIEKVKQHLKKTGISFIDNDKDERWITFFDKHEEELRDGKIKEVYTVSFTKPDFDLPDGGFIEGYLMTCFIDVETEEILYFDAHHRYIEADGSQE